jgi:hypothetical protein
MDQKPAVPCRVSKPRVHPAHNHTTDHVDGRPGVNALLLVERDPLLAALIVVHGDEERHKEWARRYREKCGPGRIIFRVP